MPAADSKLPKKDLDRVLKEIKMIRDLIEAIKKVGGEVPVPLTKALKALETALKAAKEVGEAMDEAENALDKYNKGLMAACKDIDEEQQAVCEAGVARKYQAVGVSFVLSPKNKDSVISVLIKKAIKKATPSLICKNWERCAKIAE